MKRYKLVKEYPGSPKLGTIVKQEWLPNVYYYYDTKSISNTYIENQPEFYEEVIEQDYEILSFRFKDYKIITIAKKDEIQMRLSNSCEEIYSVFRKSDGEVFTIGDKVSPSLFEKKTSFIIDELKIIGNTICIRGDKNQSSLEYIHHIKTKLFTTEDGVDIFEDNKCYFVNRFFDITETIGNIYYDKQNLKYFSTKEKAEEYIIMNKPCLSLNDILQFEKKYAKNSGIYIMIEELVKKKLGYEGSPIK